MLLHFSLSSSIFLKYLYSLTPLKEGEREGKREKQELSSLWECCGIPELDGGAGREGPF